ncbi:hypothetical protein EDD85DRAFT_956371 [Armillaria nabsnona]|nr:hypothetical protein EDD85DRAFT_956371 [Armillaria nabsnona]
MSQPEALLSAQYDKASHQGVESADYCHGRGASEAEGHRDKKRHGGHQGNQKQITIPSSKNTTGGATSSSMGKVGANDKGRDSAGQWQTVKGTTYGGTGEPMQIDTKKEKQRSEGHCFRCDEKGHLSRDCPHKKKEQVHAVEAVVKPLFMDTKIEEVKG